MQKSLNTQLNFIRSNSHMKPRVTYSGTNEGQQYNEAYKFFDVAIENARFKEKKFTLNEHGFELIEHHLTDTNFENNAWISEAFYSEIKNIVAKASGASEVFVFDHTIRRGTDNSKRRPAQHVHVDYTHTTAASRAAVIIDENRLERFKGKRFIQVNFWCSIKGPVEQLPLAFLDSQSLDENDLVKADIEFKNPDHLGEIYALKYNPNQKWFYYADMQPQEALLIKGYDTNQHAISKFTPHSAFIDPTSKRGAAPRQSIEVRTFAFFD